MAQATSQITAREFIEKTCEDISGNSLTAMSFFNKKLPQFKHTINSLDNSIDLDRDNLVKMKKALKAMSTNVNAHLENETNLSKVLEKLGASSISREEELEIGQAFIKFSIVASELSTLVKTLMQNLSNRVMFPLETMLKSDLKSINGDLKRPVDKALSDYESRLAKLEKDKKKKTHLFAGPLGVLVVVVGAAGLLLVFLWLLLLLLLVLAGAGIVVVVVVGAGW